MEEEEIKKSESTFKTKSSILTVCEFNRYEEENSLQLTLGNLGPGAATYGYVVDGGESFHVHTPDDESPRDLLEWRGTAAHSNGGVLDKNTYKVVSAQLLGFLRPARPEGPLVRSEP